MADYSRVRSFVAGNLIKAADFEAEFDALTANLNDRVHLDGAVEMTGNLVFDQCGLVVDNRDSSGSMWRLRDYLGSLQIDLWDLSLTPDAYTNILSIPTDYAAGEVTLKIPLKISHTAPYITLYDTTGSAQSYRFKVDADTLTLANYTSSWTDILTITDTTVGITGETTITGDTTVTGDLTVTGVLSGTLGDSCVPYSALELHACTPQTIVRTTAGAFSSALTFAYPSGVLSWMAFAHVHITGVDVGNSCYAVAYVGENVSVTGSYALCVQVTGYVTLATSDSITITVTPYVLGTTV